MKVTMYTLPKCKGCKEAKEYFNSKGIKYSEVDMSIGGDKETIEMKIQFKRMGIKEYPIIFVQRDGEDEMIFPGFDEKIFDGLIKEK